ncbi:glycosyl hydrolase family 18 protein [Bowmanella denitrificans]|uniref:glycosyl hydrolase family 18 protein n=1 Tax=Bowmanella denitrificans TaxID=366582 RepID=UPI000C9B4809|nr:glycosyl hydrolase family 18 protein [Bowmanella denitrificans]
MKPASIGMLALFASTVVQSAPSTPSIGWEPQAYSLIQVNLDGNGAYKDLVQRLSQVNISIGWNAWSGEGGDNIRVYFDGQQVHQESVAAGTRSGTIQFSWSQSGRHDLTIALCQAEDCATSAVKPLVIADSDGGHLDPLPLNVDPNNGNYPPPPDTVVGAYFVEWGIYGRAFDVSRIPVNNLTHILYGFIPICGPNESLREIENGNSLRALQTACGRSQDYEVVIHDPWAAIQKALPGTDTNDPIRGTYAQLMALKKHNPALKILPSIGGWTLSDPFHGFTQKQNRDVFIASVKEFLQTWKFYDGVDIDWEYPGGSGANPNLGDRVNDGPAYVALMAELRAMLDELEAETGRQYQLTSAIGVGYDKLEDVDYLQAQQYMDYLFAMTYDFYGGWNNVTGHHTAVYCGSHMSQDECNGTGTDDDGQPRQGPAYTLDNGIQLLLQQGVPPEKIVLGAAMYGRGWEGVFAADAANGNPMTATASGKLTGTNAQGVWEPGVIDYKGIKTYMLGSNNTGVNGFEAGYDEQAEAAYVWNSQNGKLVTYDSPRSVLYKGQYTRSLNLAGMFAWEIDADNGDILNAMHQGLAGGGLPNRPPVIQLEALYQVTGGQSIDLAAAASDPDQDPLTFQWQLDSSLDASGQNSATLRVNAPVLAQTTDYAVTLQVSDGQHQVSRATTLRVIGEQGNQPPIVAPVADQEVDENAVLAINLQSSDPDGDSLSYDWQVPQGLTLSGSGANVQLQAGNVDADTQYPVSVSVSDGQALTTVQFTVTVRNLDGGQTTWQAGTVYTAGDIVLYEGVEYRAKWWTQGDRPDLGGPWEVRIPDNGQPQAWNANQAYNGGARVSYQGSVYQARWWTQGEEPGVAAVWQLQP